MKFNIIEFYENYMPNFRFYLDWTIWTTLTTTLHKDLVQCCSNVLVCGTLFQTEIFHGTPPLICVGSTHKLVGVVKIVDSNLLRFFSLGQHLSERHECSKHAEPISFQNIPFENVICYF